VYAVDVKISADESQWAVKSYARFFPIGHVYFDVPYDENSFYTGNKKEINNHDYTLPNLRKYGGICVDQAYYSTQVAKALGVPSCVCEGQGGAGGVKHAWMGYLESSGRSVKWDFTEGRYPEDQFWSGTINDPQTGQQLDDSDVAMTAQLVATPAQARLQSIFLVKAAAALDEANRITPLIRAAELSPGNRDTWSQLAAMGGEGKLSATQFDAVSQAIVKYLAQPYPDFACYSLMKMMDSQKLNLHENSLDRLAQIFSTRPDLVAKIRLRQGDLFHDGQQDDAAMRAYSFVLNNSSKIGIIVVDGLKRCETVLRARNNLPALAQVYQSVWQKMPIPELSSFAFETPYFQVGTDYVDLLQEMGNKSAADAVLARLKPFAPVQHRAAK
jgi:hypothetical protein